MNSITCPKDGCDTDDFAGVQAIKGHINAKRNHNYGRLWPKVEKQLDDGNQEEEADDDQEDTENESDQNGEAEDDQESSDEGTDSDSASDSTEESMPSDAELTKQRQKAKQDQRDQEDDQGTQGSNSPSLPSPSVPLSTKSLLLVGGTVAAGLVLYWLLTRDDQGDDQAAPSPEQDEQPGPQPAPAQRGIIPEGNNV